MANEERSLQKIESSDLADAEATHEGFLRQAPVDIFEDQDGLTVLADLPGVTKDTLQIDLHEGILTITGRVKRPNQEGEVDVAREFDYGTFQRKFTLAEMIDQDRIDAQLRNGVLRLHLPKVEKAKPRQIAVRSE